MTFKIEALTAQEIQVVIGAKVDGDQTQDVAFVGGLKITQVNSFFSGGVTPQTQNIKYLFAPVYYEVKDGIARLRDSYENTFFQTFANLNVTESELQTLVEGVNGSSSAQIKGVYDNDDAAGTGGVQVGELYELSATNTMGLPEGTIRARRL